MSEYSTFWANILESIFDNITLILAIWGAILSTILGLAKIIDRKRRLRVSFSVHQISSPKSQTTPKGFDTVFGLSCVNPGIRPITISDYGIALSTGRNIGFWDVHPDGPVTLPKKLEYADSLGVLNYGSCLHRLFMIDRNLTPLSRIYKIRSIFFDEKDIIKIRGYFRDTLGKTYKSKKVKININELF